MSLLRLREFLRLESAAGIILVATAFCAILISNSPLSVFYEAFFDTRIAVIIGGVVEIDKPFFLWVNDGLMAVFFLLVALEIKREILQGELARRDQLVLPLAGAIGGIALPALIFVGINFDNAAALRGWAIPAATDIAFAVGVLALLGNRIPTGLKVFLLAVAILDDLAAIIIIAVFYTENLSLNALGYAAAAVVVLAFLNWRGVKSILPYLLVGLVLWVAVLKSGVHATLAGVITGFAVPMIGKSGTSEDSPLLTLEHILHPWVAYGVLPAFAFANAGLSLAGMSIGRMTEGVTLGIALGLFVGKQIGVFGMAALAIKLGFARMPTGGNWVSLYGVCILTGIGFTMSLFIGSLSFANDEALDAVRLGVLAGSIASAVLGFAILRASTREGDAEAADARGDAQAEPRAADDMVAAQR
jgi:NhaA family Na+:H+ antiporter